MNRFRLVVLAAQRARQLQAGVQSRVGTKGRKSISVAIEEVAKGLVEWQHKGEEEESAPEGEEG